MSSAVLRYACLTLVALFLATMVVLLVLTTRSTPSPPPVETVQPQQQAWSGDSTSDDDTEDAEENVVEVCVRKSTSIRVGYRFCDDLEKGYARRFLPVGKRIPAVGKKVGKGITGEYAGLTYRARDRGGRGLKNLILDEKDRIEICVRQETRVRAADRRCEDEEAGYRWYYLLLSRQIPAIGRKAANGSFLSNENSTSFRARPAGGKGSRAAIEEEPPQTTDDDSTSTRTYSGTCSMTIGGSCADDDNDSTPSWTHDCTTCTRKSTGRRRR